jgi:uncharacterized protein
MANLIGKNILIVDEVDDTRTTLEYAVKELQKDVEIMQKKLGREDEKTQFSVFVLHVSLPLEVSRIYFEITNSMEPQNKDKPKKGNLPKDMLDQNRYLAAKTVGDVWICYPWEAMYVFAMTNINMETLTTTVTLTNTIASLRHNNKT